jgi:Post-segregation antitoxin CcdA
MDGRDSKEKTKLTLSLNKDVIQRAKAAGVNISEITEKLLNLVTLTPAGSSYDDVVEAYLAFYDVIKSILQKYAAEVVVFDYIEKDNRRIVLYGRGFEEQFYDPENQAFETEPIDDLRAVRLLDTLLDKPTELLDKLIEALIEAAEENKEQIAKLQFALKLVKALAEEKGDDKN